MARYYRRLGWIVALSLTACSSTPWFEPPTVIEDTKQAESCTSACARMVSWGCASSVVCDEYSEDGSACLRSVSCTDWCVDLVEKQQGHFDANCWANTRVQPGVQDCSILEEACP